MQEARPALTPRQREIYQFILEYQRREGYPPTIREMCVRFGIRSTKGVSDHLDALEKKSYLRRKAGRSRGIELLGPGAGLRRVEDAVEVPVLGRIAAGLPILAVENIDSILAVDRSLVGNEDHFLLKVVGDSMIGDHIQDGDFVLVRPQNEAVNGEIVVALLGDEATVKRYQRKGSAISLLPSNPDYRPIEVRRGGPEFSIAGKVVGVLRKL